jgi:hypothetical protein
VSGSIASAPLHLHELVRSLDGLGEDARFHVTDTAAPEASESAAWLPVDGAMTLWLRCFAQLCIRFSEPDSVSTSLSVRVDSDLCDAVWDFDYYHYQLRAASRPGGNAVVLFARTSGAHSPAAVRIRAGQPHGE